MTRIFAFAFAALALAFSACERHPIAGETVVTHTHGSNGAPGEGHGEHGDAHAAGEHKEHAAEAHGEKPAGEHAAPAAAASGHEAGKPEEKPTFFPGQEKK